MTPPAAPQRYALARVTGDAPPRRLRLAGVAVCFALLSATAAGYVFWPAAPRWAAGSTIVMHLQLHGDRALSDGSTYNTAARSALEAWNRHLHPVRFEPVLDSLVSTAAGNGLNNVYWDTTALGRPFGGSWAYMYYWSSNGRMTEGDVIFDVNRSWDAYRGPWREAGDIRRFALHEFGHVLGLTHPDEAGQHVTAIMNSIVVPDDLQADDVEGIHALYGSPPAPPSPPSPPVGFPPRDQSLAFRQQLEAKYRDDLGRQPGASFVDLEGSIVWTQEYLRYRVNGCGHQEAVARVMIQIDGGGIQPVCGEVSAGAIAFPPRNEPYAFRLDLEAKYRDGLRRPSSDTYVDAEGDIVWTQEYLRYRVNGCGHADAVQRVLAQVDGAAVPPVCR